ncbi:DUF1249 domain-containing protein [Thiocapsa sp.]|uniref:DUF1249 domain-containing protein n=1 Tax=Thiocapsa sp. TaxID=2024551 RepID=UPI0025F62CBA|nr:DUF1249 domain-containing protein [Thiocapsa sp.]
MQRVCHPWATACVLSGRPNIGALMSLCEENFARLSRLVPDLAVRPSGVYGSRCSEGVDLYLEIEEQARFTTILRLTYIFPVQGIALPDPDARLRVYRDAGQVEVIDLRQTVLPLRADYRAPALAEKWQANVFIGKWLTYCLRQGRVFADAPVTPPTFASGTRVTLCP